MTMIEFIRKRACFIGLMLYCHISVCSQQLSLYNAIKIGQENSYSAQVAKFSFLTSYWTYRSFKAELLPSINLSGTVLNFNHSITETRNYDTGKIQYVDNNTMANNAILSLDQKILATGGTISLQSYLYRLDQFTYKDVTYNAPPLRISYNQPLRAFNTLKWQKKIAPVEYRIAQKQLVADMEDITLQVTTLFFNVLAAQSNYKLSQSTLNDRQKLLEMANKRLQLGTLSKSEVLQLELSLENAKVSNLQAKQSLDAKRYELFSFLRVTDYDQVELMMPTNVPEILLSADRIITKALENSSHLQEQNRNLLEAQKNLASAKAATGLQMTLTSEIGFTKSDTRLFDAYGRLKDNEIVGVTFSMPLFDWGMSKGKVKVAKSKLNVTKTKLEQAHNDYIQDLTKKTLQFNCRASMYSTALRAQDIAHERYEISYKRFEAGAISVTDLNTALQELESAENQYITQLQQYWSDYYTLRKATLYDWIGNRDITIDYDKITKQ